MKRAVLVKCWLTIFFCTFRYIGFFPGFEYVYWNRFLLSCSIPSPFINYFSFGGINKANCAVCIGKTAQETDSENARSFNIYKSIPEKDLEITVLILFPF